MVTWPHLQYNLSRVVGRNYDVTYFKVSLFYKGLPFLSKQPLKTPPPPNKKKKKKKIKRIRNYTQKMQSISVFLDMTNVADFRRKNVDVSTTQEVCHMIYIFFRSLNKG